MSGDGGVTVDWNGQVNLTRISVALGIVLTLVMLFGYLRRPVLDAAGVATHQWHNRDVDRMEQILACDYWGVPPADCPASPPKPPEAAQPRK